MDLSIADLLTAYDGTLVCGDESLRVSGFGSLADARPGDLAFLSDSRYSAQLDRSRASVVLVGSEFDDRAEGLEGKKLALIRVEAPSVVFGELLAIHGPKRSLRRAGIHPSAAIDSQALIGVEVFVGPHAVIEAGATIGDRAKIGPNAVVGLGVVIGEDSELCANATIADGCKIGARCLIHSGAVIGADGFGFEFKDGRHVKVPQIGNVVLGDDVEVGANSCIDRARFGSTRIGCGTKIDNLVQIGHNCDIGEHNIFCALVGVAGSATTGSYATFAAQCGVGGHLHVGDQVTIAARGGVTKTLDQKGVYAGFPPQDARDWRRSQGALTKLPEMRKELKAMQKRIEHLEG